jgi:hypothetical protein
MKRSIPEIEAIVAKLAEYFASLPDGEEVRWIRIEADTDVKMDARGKELARRALKRAKRPYEAVRGDGLRLSSPENAITIARGKLLRIDGAVKVADNTQRELQKRHLPQMSPDDQRKMLMVAGLFGAIRTIAKETTTAMLKG